MPEQLFADGSGNGYPTGIRQPLEPGCDVDAVAVNIIFVDDDIARIDTDAQFQLAVAGGGFMWAAKLRWMSTAQFTALTALSNSTRSPSPLLRTSRPSCSETVGSIRA